MTGPVPAPNAPASTRLWDYITNIGDVQFPLGSYEIGPGGWTLNDLLVPFTDVRSDTRLLPETLSINDVGRGLGALGRSLSALAPAEVTRRHYDAIAGVDSRTGEPVTGLTRLMDLFPAAGAEGGGLIAPATRAGSTTLGTYAGRRAATADQAARARAIELEAAGGNAGRAGDIRQQTGWFRDEAGDWKYEIGDQDSAIKLAEPNARQVYTGPYDPDEPPRWLADYKLGDVLEHPQLFEAYPWLKDVQVYKDTRMGPAEHGQFEGFGPDPSTWGIRMGGDPTKRGFHHGTLLHEVQHGIQEYENFARGGSSSQFKSTVDNDLVQRLAAEAQDYSDAERLQLLKGDVGQFEAAYGRPPSDEGVRLSALPREDVEGMANHLLRKIENHTQLNSPHGQYLRLLGEVEARDVEARMNYPDWKRQAVPPYTSQKIPPDQYILQKWNIGGAAEAPQAARIVGDAQRPPVDTTGFGSVFPKPQRLFDPTSPDYPPGGQYLSMPDKTDITGRSPAQARIAIGPDGRPSFKVSAEDLPEAPSRAGGATVKTNLFKQSAGWKWASRNEGVPDVPTLVSVTTGGKHYYALASDFPSGVNLTRYADAPSEPRLRPTAYGDVELGPQVGTITVRGREHPVYERATVVPKGDIPTGLDLPPEVPGSPSATPSAAHPMIGETFTDQFAAMKVWKDAGGKNGPIKVTGLPEGSPRPTSWRIDPNPQAAGAGTLPAATGQHGLVGHGPNFPGPQPVPPKVSVDRRGMPGRDPVGPRTPLGITDPEGRPLYQEALIAGIRQPGGPDVPLSMLEEVRLAQGLATLETPRGGILGANGQVVVTQPGTMTAPPAAPTMHMRVDADLPDAQYMKSFRHEGGHALDYSTERTERGFETGHRQYAVPDDVRAELHAASAEMRPDLWAPNANEIYERPTASLKEYRERPDELMADAYRFYKEDPAGFKAKYPNAAAYIRAQVNDDPLLSRHVQFNVQAGFPPIPPPDDVAGDAARAARDSWIVRHLAAGGA
jgi:Large polyvalent protein associated domain 23